MVDAPNTDRPAPGRVAFPLGPVAALLGTVLLLAGCGTLSAPEISVVGITAARQTDEGVELTVDMDLTNPNDVSLELQRLRYQVAVDGRSVYRGQRAAEATLGAGASMRLAVPAVVTWADAGWTPGAMPNSAEWRFSGRMVYLDPGRLAELLLDAGVRRPTIGFSAEGTVDPSSAPAAPPSDLPTLEAPGLEDGGPAGDDPAGSDADASDEPAPAGPDVERG